MAYTIPQLETLEQAIATGAKEVWYGDKKVIYQSLDEMKGLRNTMRNELGLNAKDYGRKIAQFSKFGFPE